MRRQANDSSPSLIHSSSSIALLQERFRNLQKVKERREGRELQRMHHADTGDHRAAGSSSTLNLGLPAANSEQPGWFLHPDLVRPSRPLHGPEYLGLRTTGAEASPAASSWGSIPRMQNSGYRSDVDVDTSLHL